MALTNYLIHNCDCSIDVNLAVIVVIVRIRIGIDFEISNWCDLSSNYSHHQNQNCCLQSLIDVYTALIALISGIRIRIVIGIAN